MLLSNCCSASAYLRYNVSCSHQFRLQRKKMKEFQEANYARVRRRGPRRSSSEIARTKIQGKRHRVRTQTCQGRSVQNLSLLAVPLCHSGCRHAGCAECALTHVLHKAQGAVPITHGLQEVYSRLYLFCALCVRSCVPLEGLSE